MAKDFPSQFGDSPMFNNSIGTVPFPPRKLGPVPQWYSGKIGFNWTATSTAQLASTARAPGYVYTYQWKSPTYDLCPWLRAGQSGSQNGAAIWDRRARLNIQLLAPNITQFTSSTTLQVRATDRINTTQANEQPRVGESTAAPDVLISAITDVSSKFSVPTVATLGVQSLHAGFAPPGTANGLGEGYPIRYWQLTLDFETYVETGTPIPAAAPAAPFTPILQAGYY